MGKKKKSGDDAGGAPAWMVTYSDLVTLLLTFFVLLLSMANMDQVKFKKARASLQNAFGVIGDFSVEQKDVVNPATLEGSPVADDMVQRVYKKMHVQFNRLKLNKDIKLVKDRDAVVLRLNASILFAPGQTALKPAAFPVLRNIAKLLRPLPFLQRIEGHSDNTPSQGGRSNWDISMLRALSVLKFFAGEKLLPLDRLSAAGYGSQRPLVPNDSAANRALNRRVDFVLESVGGYSEELPYLIDAAYQFPF